MLRRVVAAFLVALALCAAPAHAAIAFDASGGGGDNGGGSSSHSWSHTCTGTLGILFVGIVGDTSADDLTAVTYNSVAMTLVAKKTTSVNRMVYLYYLLAPATGAHTVSITASSAHYLMGNSVSYTGAKQSGQPDASGTQSTTGTGAVSQSLTTINDNAWTVWNVWGYNGFTAGTGSTTRVTGSFSGHVTLDSNSAIHPAGSYTMNGTWNQGTSSADQIMASFQPDTGGAAAPPVCQRLLLGVGGC